MNKSRPHIFVLPEDDANRQIVNGFLLHGSLKANAIQVLPLAKGWKKVLDDFEQLYVSKMNRFPSQYMVLLIDFDKQFEKRREMVRKIIPDTLKDRVFVLGVLSNPEELRAQTKRKFEDIGFTLAEECSSLELSLWEHTLLIHNREECERIDQILRPILFG